MNNSERQCRTFPLIPDIQPAVQHADGKITNANERQLTTANDSAEHSR
jgi:hypothetical protein